MRAPLLALAALALAPAAAQAQSGSRIAFTQGDTPGVWTVPAAGGTPTQLTKTGVMPSFSPNGKLLATIGPKGQVVVGNATGKGPTKVVGTQTVGKYSPKYGPAAWSPNSKQLAYTSNGSLYVVSATGGKSTKVYSSAAHAGNPVTHPVYAPDGKSVYFLMLEVNDAFDSIANDSYWLYTWPLNIKQQGKLLSREPTVNGSVWTLSPFSLSVSPDGSTLAVTASVNEPTPPSEPAVPASFGLLEIPATPGGQATAIPGLTAAAYAPTGSQLCGLATGGGLVTVAGATVSAPIFTGSSASSCTWAP